MSLKSVHEDRDDIPMSVAASTSSRSDFESDDDQSNNIPVENANEHLTVPDLIRSAKPNDMTKTYCHHLQQMAFLSEQQRTSEPAHPTSNTTTSTFA
jgi:hypothetical protein